MALAENQITLEVVEDGNAIYTEEPASPYESGDLYVKTEEVVNGLVTDDEDVIISSDSDEFETAERGEANVYVCKNDRPSGVYNPDDWQLAATDNTQLNQLKEHFWYDDTGAHVQGETTGFRNDLTSTGMKIVDTSTETSVAEFGSDGARIGMSAESHINIDDNDFSINNGNRTIASIHGYYHEDPSYFTTSKSDISTDSGKIEFEKVIRGSTGTYEDNILTISAAEDLSGNYAKESHVLIYAASDENTVVRATYLEIQEDSSHSDYDCLILSHGNGLSTSDLMNVDQSGNIKAAGDITDGSLNKLSDKIESSDILPLFDVVSVNKTFTVSANSTQNQSFAPAAADVPSGYTRVGLCGWNTANGNVFIVTCTGTTITFGNKSSSQVTCNNAQVDWLYIRSSI